MSCLEGTQPVCCFKSFFVLDHFVLLQRLCRERSPAGGYGSFAWLWDIREHLVLVLSLVEFVLCTKSLPAHLVCMRDPA